jgi:hypothetical protein
MAGDTPRSDVAAMQERALLDRETGLRDRAIVKTAFHRLGFDAR